jgi:hypothetical protein
VSELVTCPLGNTLPTCVMLNSAVCTLPIIEILFPKPSILIYRVTLGGINSQLVVLAVGFTPTAKCTAALAVTRILVLLITVLDRGLLELTVKTCVYGILRILRYNVIYQYRCIAGLSLV